MWQKAWIVAPSPTVTPGPKTTLGSIVTSRPTTVSCANQTVSGATSVTPGRHHRGAGPRLPRRLDGGEFGAAVDPGDFRCGGLDDAARAVGEGDDVGQVIFPRGIGVADAGEERPQVGAADGEDARIAQVDGALGGRRVLELDHLGDDPVVGDDPAIGPRRRPGGSRGRRWRRRASAHRAAAASSRSRPAARRRTGSGCRRRNRPARPSPRGRRGRCRADRPGARRSRARRRPPRPARAAPRRRRRSAPGRGRRRWRAGGAASAARRRDGAPCDDRTSSACPARRRGRRRRPDAAWRGGAADMPRRATSALPFPAVRPMPAGMGWPATIVFDLDGTLVDSAPDLTAALNAALADAGRPAVDPPTVRHLVGHGARALIERGLALSGGGGEAEVARALPVFLDYYAAHIADGTRPYPGAAAALDALAAQGKRLAICTNKPVALVGRADRRARLERTLRGEPRRRFARRAQARPGASAGDDRGGRRRPRRHGVRRRHRGRRRGGARGARAGDRRRRSVSPIVRRRNSARMRSSAALPTLAARWGTLPRRAPPRRSDMRAAAIVLAAAIAAAVYGLGALAIFLAVAAIVIFLLYCVSMPHKMPAFRRSDFELQWTRRGRRRRRRWSSAPLSGSTRSAIRR